MICEMCKKVGTAQQAMAGERMCPAHNKQGGKEENQYSYIGNRPEDFLPTGEKRVVCEEVLRRSVKGLWEGSTQALGEILLVGLLGDAVCVCYD